MTRVVGKDGGFEEKWVKERDPQRAAMMVIYRRPLRRYVPICDQDSNNPPSPRNIHVSHLICKFQRMNFHLVCFIRDAEPSEARLIGIQELSLTWQSPSGLRFLLGRIDVPREERLQAWRQPSAAT